ncbi:MAG: N-acetylneuraminate synthase family protein [Chloroflexota bacterium]
MPVIKIGERLIGDGQPAYVIAEIGVNHNGFLDLALKLIDVAVEAGADAVKFQKRKLDQLYAKKYLENANAGEKTLRYLLPYLQKSELSDDDYDRIVEHCRARGITFLASAFDRESADFLEDLGVPAYKVASADLTNLPLLDHLAAKGKPLILSTGMSHMHEVEVTVDFLKERRAEFALLHCNSTYPAAFEDINLRFMDKLRCFGVPVGYSGHERGIAVSTVASALGASIIERHLTIDRTMDGPDHAASLEPQGFQKMVRDIRQVASALGAGEEKFISRGEILNREVLSKSLVAARRIEPGETVTAQMVAVKGPALGITPQSYTRLLGRTIERVIEEDEPFLDRDLGVRIELEKDRVLPMDFGFTVRFHDYAEMLAYQPRMLEFHFTDQDLDDQYSGEDFSARSARPLKLVVHAPEFWDRSLVDLCAIDERHRAGSVRLIQKSINLARAMAPYFIGVPKVIIHPGAMSLDHPVHDKARLYENLRRSVLEIDHQGVEMLLENLPPHPWYFGGQWLTNAFMDACEIRDFIASMGLKFCYDSSHHKLYCNWAQVDLYEQLAVLLPYIGHLHLSDGAGLDGEGLQIGEGAIDWVHFFRVLGDYRGTMIPEIWRGHQRQGEGFLIAIQRLSDAYAQSRAAG